MKYTKTFHSWLRDTLPSLPPEWHSRNYVFPSLCSLLACWEGAAEEKQPETVLWLQECFVCLLVCKYIENMDKIRETILVYLPALWATGLSHGTFSVFTFPRKHFKHSQRFPTLKFEHERIIFSTQLYKAIQNTILGLQKEYLENHL